MWHEVTAAQLAAEPDANESLEQIADGLLKAELAIEFDRLNGSHHFHGWSDFEEQVFQHSKVVSAKWAEERWWWDRSVGRRHVQERTAKHVALLRSTVVATRWCRECGKQFDVTAYQDRQKTRMKTFCSVQCGAANMRKSVKPGATYTINGVTLTLAGWCKRYSISEETVRSRLKRGLPIEAALAEKPTSVRMFTINGETMDITKWCERTGLKRSVVSHRIDRGWTIEQALEMVERPNALRQG